MHSTAHENSEPQICCLELYLHVSITRACTGRVGTIPWVTGPCDERGVFCCAHGPSALSPTATFVRFFTYGTRLPAATFDESTGTKYTGIHGNPGNQTTTLSSDRYTVTPLRSVPDQKSSRSGSGREPPTLPGPRFQNRCQRRPRKISPQ